MKFDLTHPAVCIVHLMIIERLKYVLYKQLLNTVGGRGGGGLELQTVA
jgi:hypothetical protein